MLTNEKHENVRTHASFTFGPVSGKLHTMLSWTVKARIGFALGVLWLGPTTCSSQAAFSSLYIFGDGVSTTTNNTTLYPSGTNFFGRRFTNGRVWVEVLAQQQGLTNNFWYSTSYSNPVSYTNLTSLTTNWSYSSNNWSYFGDDSTNLVRNVNHFNAPPDATNALFVVWVNDADFVNSLSKNGTNSILWTNSINQFLTNHFTAVTNLYAKGARTLIMPNAVDISTVPAYQNYAAATNGFLRQRVISFNNAFTTTLMNRIKANCPSITIYIPDFFSLLDNMLTNAAAYGLTNAGNYALNQNPPNILTNLSMTGPGANYIWWDNQDPTAKAHAVMATLVQQLISPVRISQITADEGGNWLALTNVPIGLNGFVESSTDLVWGNWTTAANIVSTNSTQTIFVPAADPPMFYRLRFPYAWTWP